MKNRTPRADTRRTLVQPSSELRQRWRVGRPATVTGFPAQYDVTADGQRFLLKVPVDEDASSPAITVVLNWAAGLRK